MALDGCLGTDGPKFSQCVPRSISPSEVQGSLIGPETSIPASIGQLHSEIWRIKVFRIRHLAPVFRHFQAVGVGERPNQASDVAFRDDRAEFRTSRPKFMTSGPKYTVTHMNPKASYPTALR
jgi:hypothetical protein